MKKTTFSQSLKKSSFLKALFVFFAMTLITTSVFAFGGGGGSSRVATRYKKGVDAMGIHVDPQNPIVPPDYRDCDANTETLVGTEFLQWLLGNIGE